MTDSVRVYCSAARQLEAIERKAKEDLQEVRDARKAANALLLELQTEEEMVARLQEGCFCVRVKVSQRRAVQSMDVLQKMEGFWESGRVEEWKRRIVAEAESDPIASLVEAVIEGSWPPPLEKRSLEIKRAKETSARVQDLPAAPARNSPLVASVVEAKRIMSERLAVVREEKKVLKEQQEDAERLIIPELAQLPEGYIRKVELRDASGSEESFYLRLKPPRKRPQPKVSEKTVAKTMKLILEERAPTAGRQGLIDCLALPRFGVQLCRDVACTLGAAGEKETPGPRIKLDRLHDSAASA
jgi:hypothetical protein